MAKLKGCLFFKSPVFRWEKFLKKNKICCMLIKEFRVHIPFRQLLSLIFQVHFKASAQTNRISRDKGFCSTCQDTFFPISWNDGRKNYLQTKHRVQNLFRKQKKNPLDQAISNKICISCSPCREPVFQKGSSMHAPCSTLNVIAVYRGLRNYWCKRKNYALIAYYYLGRYYLPW